MIINWSGMNFVSVLTLEPHANTQMYSISIASDITLVPGLILFISLCFSAGDFQVAAYGFWLFTQLVVGWGLAGLFWQNQDKKTILIELWLAFRVSCPGPGWHESRVLKEIYFLIINLLFAWRFFNVPQHWTHVGDSRTWITGLMVLLSDMISVTIMVINLARWAFEVSRCPGRMQCKKRWNHSASTVWCNHATCAFVHRFILYGVLRIVFLAYGLCRPYCSCSFSPKFVLV